MRSRRNPGLEPGGVTIEGGPAVHDARATTQDSGAGEPGTIIARRFPADCVSVREARRFLLGHLRGDGHEDLGPFALMLSELATNAVQHADTAFEVGITVSEETEGRTVEVRVTDEAPGFPVPQQPPPDRPRGRGLRIVESLADAWGIEVQHGRPGKTVWFTSRLEPAPTSWGSRVDRVDRSDASGQDDERDVGITAGAGAPHGTLRGRSGLELVPSKAGPSQDGFATFMRTQAEGLAGRRLHAVVKRAEGSDDIAVLAARRRAGTRGAVGPARPGTGRAAGESP